MSILDRFFGFSRSHAYNEGLALLEDGRFAEAVVILRKTVGEGIARGTDDPAGNLLRRALIAEGRRLARMGRVTEAMPLFGEAAAIWDTFPDLHWWHGAAAALAGDHDTALQDARTALRLNPDYAEARLLEAVALTGLGRSREAADALNALRESGRRVDHWLTQEWGGDGAVTADNLPAGLRDELERIVQGETDKEKLASAVALCRAGHWDEGIAAFGDLVSRRPRYPDYRTRLAAALFHRGRGDEALAEVDAALEANPGYGAAIDLKALILADLARYADASAILEGAERRGDAAGDANPHEALFSAYLRGVLDLLLGRADQVEGLFREWSNLAKSFARAEMLMAAADDLQGRQAAAGSRLLALFREWPAEPEFAFLLACHQLGSSRPEEAAATLQRWPRESGTGPDARPLFLQARLALRTGRIPDLPDVTRFPADGPDEAGDGPRLRRQPSSSAWSVLRAEAALLKGRVQECREILEGLAAAGPLTEQVLRLLILSATREPLPAEWTCDPVMPDSCLPPACALALMRGDGPGHAGLLRPVAALQPDCLLGVWLDPRFWLEPVRGWIA
ncbi:tetratricopeptide repeat protein [bacterium]|nr:tetratricopeptide repeat protein [bacterium]